MNKYSYFFLSLLTLSFYSAGSSATTLYVGCSESNGATVTGSSTFENVACVSEGTTFGAYNVAHDTSASASLESGSIHLKATHTGVNTSSKANAQGKITENIKIHGGSGVITFEALFAIDGFGVGVEGGTGNGVTTDFRISTTGGNPNILNRSFTSIGWDINGDLIASTDTVTHGQGDNVFTFLDDSFDVVHRLTYEMDLDNIRDLTLSANVNVSAALATVDMSHTGYFDVILPEGLSFTSDSGVFLTEPLNSLTVPEPSAIVLMGLGLLGFVATRRKIKK